MSSINQLGVAADHVCRHPVMRQEVMKAYPHAKFNEAGHRMGEDETIAFLKDCDAAIIGFEPINERTLSALPNLKTIGKYGDGCETIDFAALKRHGVKFGYTWGANRLAVAELDARLHADGAALRDAAQPRDARRRAAAHQERPVPHRPHRRHPRLRPHRQGGRAAAAAVQLQRSSPATSRTTPTSTSSGTSRRSRSTSCWRARRC